MSTQQIYRWAARSVASLRLRAGPAAATASAKATNTCALRGISSKTKASSTTTKWTAQELAALQTSASNFSSASRVLQKDHGQDHEHKHSHSHAHSHGLFSSHSHSHSTSETAAKMDLLEHHQAGSRITLIGMGANMGMTVAKGVAGVYFHSSALLADAAHSLSDILGDIVTLYTFRKSRKPADLTHPYGYGRYEALGTLFVSAFLVAAGVGIGTHAFENVVRFLPDLFAATVSSGAVESAREILGSGDAAGGSGMSSLFSLGHDHSHAAAHKVVDGSVVVDPRAIWFAIGSIAINEALFQATMKVGRRTNSDVLVANAWHHRSDALTSLVSVGAIAGAIVGFPILDAIGGLAVSMMLAKSGVSMAADAIREITDTPPAPQLTNSVSDALAAVCDGVDEVRGFDNVLCRKSGPFVHVSVGLLFAPDETAAGIESAVERVRSELRERLDFVQTVDINVGTK
ncbi:mitochondrial metal transporter [Coemansia sp. RSA 2599]|nr:mitochondrial metal transporter [Coemansia sp. RSA 2598]KAJ1829259.1 mitochondrial metal transporter [Coemansia sp. RSA 2599]